MGYTTKISDYELARGDGPEPCEGVDIESDREKPAKSHAPVTTSKVVEPEKKTLATKSTARTKSK